MAAPSGVVGTSRGTEASRGEEPPGTSDGGGLPIDGGTLFWLDEGPLKPITMSPHDPDAPDFWDAYLDNLGNPGYESSSKDDGEDGGPVDMNGLSWI